MAGIFIEIRRNKTLGIGRGWKGHQGSCLVSATLLASHRIPAKSSTVAIVVRVKYAISIAWACENHPLYINIYIYMILETYYIYIIDYEFMREQESMAALIAKMAPCIVSKTLPHRRIVVQRSMQRPQACSLIWTGQHCEAVC